MVKWLSPSFLVITKYDKLVSQFLIMKESYWYDSLVSTFHFYFMAVLWAIASGTEYLILIDRKKHKRLMEKYGQKICVGMATKEQ